MNFVRGYMLVCGMAMMAMGIQSYFFPSEGAKPSPISLAAAGGIGLMIFVMGVLAIKLPNPRIPYIVALVLALLPLGQFMPKIFNGTAEPYPHYLGLAISVSLILVLLGGHIAKKRSSTSATGE
ncbi:hypothetical protein QPK87_19250 [Kamptonema cortianum]|nr:hypothetical protein [Geitlerinema splendidum]MDK3158693.1 hypothetical protein [Kamptonema cortianum]